METYIKYTRINETCDEISIQDLFDRLVKEGWEIIYYKEYSQAVGDLSRMPAVPTFYVVIVAGKRQSNELKKINL